MQHVGDLDSPREVFPAFLEQRGTDDVGGQILQSSLFTWMNPFTAEDIESVMPPASMMRMSFILGEKRGRICLMVKDRRNSLPHILRFAQNGSVEAPKIKGSQ